MEGMEQSPSHITKEPKGEFDNTTQPTSTTYEVNGEIISLPHLLGTIKHIIHLPYCARRADGSK